MDSGKSTTPHLYQPIEHTPRVEAACRKFAEALRRGELPSVENIVNQAEPDERKRLLRELLTREMEFRAGGGETPPLEEYRERFPDDARLVKYLYCRHFIPDRVGEFSILRLVGRGGFGLVYQAWDKRLSRHVAIKVFTSDPDDPSQGSSDLLVEARSAAQLRHPGIVAVHAVMPDADGDEFLVLEFVDGRSLEDVLRTERFSAMPAAELVLAVTVALHHAHEHGLVHRDLKPANILIDQRGHPRVTDFGLALHLAGLQRKREIVGTLPYMAPEQANGETHRVDPRTDLWSLGVVFYRLLSSRLPFGGATRAELFDAIRYKEPEDLSASSSAVPAELARIVRRCLAKRMSQRYGSAAELAEDLRAFLRDSESGRRRREAIDADEATAAPVVPKGLRCFDSGDQEFFLQLVPGPRDRHGVPQGVRFWQRHLNESDRNQTFRVGLLYGPSGCGKSSLLRAGILPRLPRNIKAVVIDGARENTDSALVAELCRQFPGLPSDATLGEILAQLREGTWLAAGEKLVLVFDQFEQWLHVWRQDEAAPLLETLRQCDGGRIQGLVLVRDDFWMPATRFFHQLDVPLVEGFNSAAVDLFDPAHAGKVLAAFGAAYGTLPSDASAMSSEQCRFLDRAVAELAVDGWIVPVRLCIFAEMVKSRPWTPDTLRKVGGAQGLGAAFLEDVFDGPMAAPAHRVHRRAARAVLERLLPPLGTDIRGHLVGESELRKVADYEHRPADFAALIRCLDQELRLITPSESGSTLPDGTSQTPGQYQLTHDYLVTAIRGWLNQTRRRTIRGRAELRLGEYAAAYARRPEPRQLPSWWEWCSFLLLTAWRRWEDSQRAMMRAATRRYAARSGVVVVVVALLTALLYDRIAAIRTDGLVQALVTSDSRDVPEIVDQLTAYRRWARPRLAASLAAEKNDPDQRIRLLLGLMAVGDARIDELGTLLFEAEPPLVGGMVDLLDRYGGLEQLQPRLQQVASDTGAKPDRRLRACIALAPLDSMQHADKWTSLAPDAADILVRDLAANPRNFDPWVAGLQPVREWLVEPLSRRFSDPALSTQQKTCAADILALYAADDAPRLAELALRATPRQFDAIARPLIPQAERVRAELAREAGATLPDIADENEKDRLARRQANAILLLRRMGDDRYLWPALGHRPDPRLRSFLIYHLHQVPETVDQWLARLSSENDPGIRQAMILLMGAAGAPPLSDAQRDELCDTLLRIYRDDADSGVHAAADWTLRRWNRTAQRDQAIAELAKLPRRPGYGWYVTQSGITMVIFQAPGPVQLGSPETEPGHESDEGIHTLDVDWSFAISATEITQQQFKDICPEYDQYLNEFATRPNCPANGMTWLEALRYCRLLCEREGVPDTQMVLPKTGDLLKGKQYARFRERSGYRLPIEAEWEMACRAGTTTPRFFGYAVDLLPTYCCYIGNSEAQSWEVGTGLPNAAGLFDTLGNVAEWCFDPYDEKPDSGEIHEPPGTPLLSRYAGRGNEYASNARMLRAANRFSSRYDQSYYSRGLRIAHTILPASPQENRAGAAPDELRGSVDPPREPLTHQ